MTRWKQVLVSTAACVALPVALACPGKTASAGGDAAATVDASKSAKRASLIGSNCSYSTGMMARRVLAEGDEYTYIGMLESFTNDLESGVAAPYRVTTDEQTYVIANELMEQIAEADLLDTELSLQGKLLDVDGTRYVVLTTFRPANS